MSAFPDQLLYHVDPETGRELIVSGWDDGTATIAIYQDPDRRTTRYRVELPWQLVVDLVLALAAHAGNYQPWHPSRPTPAASASTSPSNHHTSNSPRSAR